MKTPYSDGTIRHYLDDAASDQPTPGGGSVSALAGALGVSMASMAANFTVGKKKFADVEDRCREALDQCERARADLLALADEDTRAYAKLSQAYSMPKAAPEEKKARKKAIQAALRVAMDVPLRAFKCCAEVCDALEELVEIANPNLISDVGVAALLVLAALEGSKLNVDVNLKFIKDESFVDQTRSEVEAAREQARKKATAVFEKVAAELQPTD